MPTRNDFETLNALIADAAALCEAAQEELERIHAGLLKAIDEGRAVTRAMVANEDRARSGFLAARTRLSRRQSRLD